jgi:CDP-6-deoxy-D-xylo-4-hexulose-3-dehydrase
MLKKLNNSIRVPYALAIHGEEEEKRVLKVLREHRTNTGIEIQEFERRTAKNFGKKYGIMVNSGSSANLLALEILNLPKGSEIITPILTFSTTVSPIIKLGLTPVFVDVIQGKYFINVGQIEKLITKKTRALMIPLLFGNIPDMQKLRKIAKKHKLYLIEDSCDTYAAKYKNKPTGTYSDITTTSFFGSHIITTGGNGGMVMVNKPYWRDRLKMLRGWGRSSSLFSESEDIAKRFSKKLNGIVYDAKFIFDEIGYNLLPNEMCAAFGNAQLKKLPIFRKTRENNFKELSSFFKQYEKFFILPKQDELVQTQWLAFPLTISKNAPFTRLEITTYLENNNVQTRPVFTGNILNQPGFKNIKYKNTSKNFLVADEIMERGFVIGCHHGLENRHMKILKNIFEDFLRQYSR